MYTSHETRRPFVAGKNGVEVDSPGTTYPLRFASWKRQKTEPVDPETYLFVSCAGRFHEVLSQAMEGARDPQSRLRALVVASFTFAEVEPHAFACILERHYRELAKGIADPLPIQVFEEVLKSGIREGVFGNGDPVLTAGWIVALIQRAIVFEGTGRLACSKTHARLSTIESAVLLAKSSLEAEWL